MSKIELTYPDWMKGLMNAPYDASLCGSCGGIGAVLTGCCSGRECGCMGLPIDADPCTFCGTGFPTDDQIASWIPVNVSTDKSNEQ